jgi:hypothetical protein
MGRGNLLTVLIENLEAVALVRELPFSYKISSARKSFANGSPLESTRVTVYAGLIRLEICDVA